MNIIINDIPEQTEKEISNKQSADIFFFGFSDGLEDIFERLLYIYIYIYIYPEFVNQHL